MSKRKFIIIVFSLFTLYTGVFAEYVKEIPVDFLTHDYGSITSEDSACTSKTEPTYEEDFTGEIASGRESKLSVIFKEVNRVPKFRAQNARCNVSDIAKNANKCSKNY